MTATNKHIINAIKVLCFVLAVILAATVAVLVYFKWDKGEFAYIDGEKSGTVTITGYIGESNDVVIPDRLRGKKVTSISEDAFMDSEITSVKFNDNITSISDSAFNGCKNLTDVEVGDGVLAIGNYAFSNCTSLKTVTLGKSVEKWGVGIFANDTALESVEFIENENFVIDNNIIYSADMTTLYEIMPYAHLKEFEVPSTVTTLNDYAFGNQSELTSLTLSPSIKSIPTLCFLNCTSLKEVTIPEGVQKIDSGILANSGIERIVIPKSVTDINKTAFAGTEVEITIVTPENSNAAFFAEANDIKVEILK